MHATLPAMDDEGTKNGNLEQYGTCVPVGFRFCQVDNAVHAGEKGDRYGAMFVHSGEDPN